VGLSDMATVFPRSVVPPAREEIRMVLHRRHARWRDR
jgi:hypothetical protein